jgi:predicted nucleic acid-binding protein
LILLDTNVVSEPLSARPHPEVLAWIDAQASGTLFLSAVSVAEILFGVTRLPEGRRKNQLRASAEELLALFATVTLAFDEAAARRFAALAALARESGQAFPTADGYIAAIASVHGLAVATRDSGPFLAAGLTVINPWRHPAG